MSVILNNSGIVFPDGTTQTTNYYQPVFGTSLAPGQIRYIDPNGTTSTPLDTTCGDNQVYEIIGTLKSSTTGAANRITLLPNNTSYGNIFHVDTIVTNVSTVSQAASMQAGFNVSWAGDPRYFRLVCYTKTNSKMMNAVSYGYDSATPNWYWSKNMSMWATSGGNTTFDTTTAWTSLGTISSTLGLIGTIFIRRLV